MKISSRVESLPPYLFVEVSRRVSRKKAQGEKIIDFGIGDPDIPTPPHIIERLREECLNPQNHRYPETSGLLKFRRAISDWYFRRFGVSLNPEKEVLPLLGSKEGIGHLSFCFIDPGDIALIPDPGYPVYAGSTLLCGGKSFPLPLREENGFLPLLEEIPLPVASRAKLLWLNYPNNPTGASADMDFFERVVSFARRHDLVVCHDAAYTEVYFDNYRPPSLMQVTGAKEVGVEFHSLSKTYNMTGWRVGMAVGNPEIIDALFRFKSNLDSGVPQAIQYAAIEALSGPQDSIVQHNLIYQKRRDKLVYALNEVGLEAKSPSASFYVWAKVPSPFLSGEFAHRLLNDVGVVVTPGRGYGQYGEGYIRLSLTIPDEELDEGINRIRMWHS